MAKMLVCLKCIFKIPKKLCKVLDVITKLTMLCLVSGGNVSITGKGRPV